MTLVNFQPSEKIRPLKKATEWARDGVKVQYDERDVPRIERETTIAYLEGPGEKAEICTMQTKWQRRLEHDGARPESITVYGDGHGAEFRWYVVPKSWVRMPIKPRSEKNALLR